MKSAMTVASVDSSGGAGISADLRAFSYAGVHGCAVVCCVTAQNTKEIVSIHEVPLNIISDQIDAILKDITVAACKTGMLHSPEIVTLIAKKLGKKKFPLVVDPVMKATAGSDLSRKGFVDALKDRLIPQADLVTPNIPEAEALLGHRIGSLDDMKSAAAEILKFGCKNVLLKGGHLGGQNASDVLYDGREYHLFLSSRIPKDVHGTGCAHSALICAYLAKKMDMAEAVSEAKLHVSNLFMSSYSIGSGFDVASMAGRASFSPSELEVVSELQGALFELLDVLPGAFVPEVGINFGYALSEAETQDDVCALEGRLVRIGDRVGHLGELAFGASKHIARVILTAMKHDPHVRSAVNIRYSPETVEKCTALGLLVGNFDRQNEPAGRHTMDWGTEFAISVLGRVPDVVYDTGGIGKEPMIRILGQSPFDVLKKLKRIVENG